MRLCEINLITYQVPVTCSAAQHDPAFVNSFDVDICNIHLARQCMSYFCIACKIPALMIGIAKGIGLTGYTAQHWELHLNWGTFPLPEDVVNMVIKILSVDECFREPWLRMARFQWDIDFLAIVHGIDKHGFEFETAALQGRTRNASAASSLYYAVWFEFKDVVLEMLRRGMPVNAGGQWGTALHVAAYCNWSEVIQILLDHGADPNAEHESVGTPLNVAARFGWPDRVRLLVSAGADANASGNWGSPLITAAWYGKDSVVLELLQLGADVDLVNMSTPAFSALWAAAEAGHLDTVSLLIDHNATVNLDVEAHRGCMNNFTRFTGVTDCGTHSCVTDDLSLIGPRARSSREDPGRILYMRTEAKTALQAPMKRRHEEVVLLLLERGADATLTPESARSFQRWAEKHGRTEVLAALTRNLQWARATDQRVIYTPFQSEYLSHLQRLWPPGSKQPIQVLTPTDNLVRGAQYGNIQAIQDTLDNGAYINGFDHEFKGAALHYAVQGGHEDAVCLLLQHHVEEPHSQADVNLCSDGMGTALIIASKLNHTRIVKLLLKHEADLEVHDHRYRATALWWAVRYGHKMTVVILLAHGANMDVCDVYGQSLEDVALHYGHDRIYSVLILTRARLAAIAMSEESPAQGELDADTLNTAHSSYQRYVRRESRISVVNFAVVLSLVVSVIVTHFFSHWTGFDQILRCYEDTECVGHVWSTATQFVKHMQLHIRL